MGVKRRIKEAAGGPGEAIDDVRRMGIAGSVIKRAGVFSERNAKAIKSLGEDLNMTRG